MAEQSLDWLYLVALVPRLPTPRPTPGTTTPQDGLQGAALPGESGAPVRSQGGAWGAAPLASSQGQGQDRTVTHRELRAHSGCRGAFPARGPFGCRELTSVPGSVTR